VEAGRLLLLEFLDRRPIESAPLLESLRAEEAAGILAEIEPGIAAGVLRRMAPAAALASLKAMTRQKAAAIVAVLPFDIAANLIRRMALESRQAILDNLPARVAEAIGRLLVYPEDSVGALMDPRIQVLPKDITVGEALHIIQRSPENLYFYIYVVDRDQRLIGVLDIRELMLAAREDPLGAIMHAAVATLPPRARLKSILAHPGWHDFDALPVVDDSGRFLGALRNRRVRDLERRLAARGETGSGIDMLLSLGEMYWTGLSDLLFGVASAAASSARKNSADA